MSPHTDPGALLKLLEELKPFVGVAWSSVSQERMLVRIDAALRQAASQGNAGGERSEVQSREAIAKIVYDAFPFTPFLGFPQKPEWVTGGNSFNQDDARRAADKILALGTAQAPTMPLDVLLKVHHLASICCDEDVLRWFDAHPATLTTASAAQASPETCGTCMGSGYSNHPDSGEICLACGGQGVELSSATCGGGK